MGEGAHSAVHDVVIVGAGPVGLALACLLAARGVDAVVLERNVEPSQRTRAFGVHAPGLGVLDACGVGHEVRAAAVAIHDGRVECRGRVLGRMRFAEPIRSLPQGEVEALLVARLEALRPGALRRGIEVVGVGPGGGGGVSSAIEVRCAPSVCMTSAVAVAAGARPEAGVEVVRGRFLVVAEGVRSGLRDALGFGWCARAGRGRYAMADAADGTADAASAVLRFEPAGVVESFPLPEGRRRWVAWRSSGDDVDAAGFARLVADRTGAVPDWLTEPSAFEAEQRVADRFARGRIALVGDAAHEVSPIGGQGMNLGWLDAAALAEALVEGVRRPVDDVGAGDTVFAGYARRRRRAALRACRRAAFNMRMGAPARGIRLALRNAAVRACAVPPLRAVLAAAFTMRGL